jgi:hypothetical protein
MWINEKYDPAADGANREREIGGGRVLFPKTGAAIRWWECWGREVGEMNGSAISSPATSFSEEGGRSGTGGEGGRGTSPVPGWQSGRVYIDNTKSFPTTSSHVRSWESCRGCLRQIKFRTLYRQSISSILRFPLRFPSWLPHRFPPPWFLVRPFPDIYTHCPTVY